ncbi:uncharacterized protein LOC129643285 [Bubalus kerabau]|uniref:uncharacterized protein LOC129643285 n=1 Tax=Bubalus carabanensis TaxID=3119969 RepID=UPI00244EAEB0|nr:uncharacterized protein LOC129643285 [Bubalus carabanensis]
MKVPRQTGRQREGATDRQTRSRARAHTHTHTHTHGHRDRGRVTERRQTGDRQGREDGIGSETDTLAQTVTHLRGRPRGSSSFPKGGGVSLGPGPAGRLKAVPWGWRSPVETPRLPRLQGPIRLGYLKRDPAPAPRPEDDSAATCCLVNIVNMWESSKSSKSLVVVLGKTSVLSCSVVPNFDATHGLRPVRLLCPRLCPGKNTGAGCHFLLQGILPTQGSNPSLLQVDAFPSEPGYC